MALALAQAGANLVVPDVNGELAERSAAQIRSLGGRRWRSTPTLAIRSRSSAAFRPRGSIRRPRHPGQQRRDRCDRSERGCDARRLAARLRRECRRHVPVLPARGGADAEPGQGKIVNIASIYGMVGTDERLYVHTRRCIHQGIAYNASKGRGDQSDSVAGRGMGAARHPRQRHRAGHDESGQASARPERKHLGQPGRTHADAADRERRGPARRGAVSCHRQRRTSSPATCWWSMAAGPPGSRMVQPLRFGLIGCGQQGREHIAALGPVAGAQLVACSDPAPESLAAVEGGPEGGALCRFRAMLEQTQLDAVDRRHDPRRAGRCRAGRASSRLPRLLREAAGHERGPRAPGRRSRASGGRQSDGRAISSVSIRSVNA